MEQVSKNLIDKGLTCLDKSKFSRAQYYLSMALVCINQLEPTSGVEQQIHEIHYMLGISYLKNLEYALGFVHYAHVLNVDYGHGRPIIIQNQSITMDTNVLDKTILIYSIFCNDYIMLFCRYIPSFIKKFKPLKVIVEVPLDILPIISDIPWLETCVVTPVREDHVFDYHVEISTLPGVVGTDSYCDTKLEIVPFIEPNVEITHRQLKMLKTYLSSKRVVLLNLLINPQIDNKPYYEHIDENYIKDFTEHFENISFLTLQPFNTCPVMNNVLVDMSPVGYEKIVSYISIVEFVVTRCSFIAHLAGSMGKKVLLVLEKHHEWIWYNIFWYPNVIIFKQRECNQWYDVFQELKSYIDGHH